MYETDGSNNIVAQYNYDVNDKLISMTRGGTTYYYQFNGHGDVVALTDSAGAVVKSYSYDAYGNIISQTGSLQNPYLYAGYRYDEETGMYYLNTRYYEPTLGRFITRDTFHGVTENPASINQYAYAQGNPIMYADPSGNVPVFILNIMFNAGTGALGGVIAYFLDIAITGKSFDWWALFKSATYGASSNVVLGFFGAPKSTVGKVITGAGKGMIAGWSIGKIEKMGVRDFINNVALSAVIGAATELLGYKSAKAKSEFYKMKKSIRDFEQFRNALRKAAQR